MTFHWEKIVAHEYEHLNEVDGQLRPEEQEKKKNGEQKKKGLVETLTMEESSEGDNIDKCH